MTLGLMALVASTAMAVDMDRLPAPYGFDPIATEGVGPYSRHPAPGVTLPLFEGSRFCRHEERPTVVLAPVEGDLPVATGAPLLLLADADARVADVLRDVPPQRIYAGFVNDALRPSPGAWCGFPIAFTQTPQGRILTWEDWQDRGRKRRLWKRVHAGERATFAVPPDAPWADVEALYGDILRPPESSDRVPDLYLYIDESAPPVPHVDRGIGEYEAPTRMDVTVEGADGEALAYFETPTRLVYKTGALLALFHDGEVYVRGSSGETQAYDMSTLASPGFEGVGRLTLLDGEIGEARVEGTRRYIAAPIGRVRGEPDRVQRMMLRLGLEHALPPNIAVMGLADAMPDGELRMSFDAPGRWSAEGIQLADATYLLTDLSALVETSDGPQMRCRPDPDSPETITLTLRHALRGEHDDSLPISVVVGTHGSLDHPQVRAACIGAAHTLATYAAAGRRGEEAEVIGGTIGGRTGLDIPTVQPHAVVMRRREAPQYPPEARDGYPGITSCRVEVTIDESGDPFDVAPTDCPAAFVEAARSAVYRSRWYPYRVQGMRTAARFVMTFQFEQ